VSWSTNATTSGSSAPTSSAELPRSLSRVG
jgi:hypothetical protein